MRTVPSDRLSRSAMSPMVEHSAEVARTSYSRGERGLGPALSAAATSAGSITRSPASTRRIAVASSRAGLSFTRNAEAPASSARRRYCGRPNVVRMMTRHSGRVSRSTAAAAMPSLPGISMSSSATSGRIFVATAMASAPSVASPTTSMSSSRPSRVPRAPRSMPWSSAIRIRIISVAPELRRDGGSAGSAGVGATVLRFPSPWPTPCRSDGASSSCASHTSTPRSRPQGARTIPPRGRRSGTDRSGVSARR